MSKLNYCIMKGDGSTDAYIVYVLLPDTGMPHPSVADNKDFPEFKQLMERHGFDQTTMMTFRIGKRNKLKVRTLHSDLLDNGFHREKSVERKLKEHLSSATTITHYDNINSTYYASADTQTMTTTPTFTTSQGMSLYVPTPHFMDEVGHSRRRKSRIIDVNERIKLNVYLFLRAVPTEDDTIEFEFEFDFFSRSNSDTRRFVKPIECMFLRKDQGTSKVMYLESEKTLEDMLKEMDFLFTMRMGNPNDLLNGMKPDLVMYNAVEIKDFLNLDGRISLCVDIRKNYNEILELSDNIERERLEHEREAVFLLSLVRKEVNRLIARLEHRMLYYSDNEHYELASAYKKNREYIQKKVQLLDSLTEQGITKLDMSAYEEKFTLKDIDL